MLSVIVPVHNVAPYLRRCMDSILHDNPTADFEVIAVDDASTDASPSILSTYADDPRVRIHSESVNGGLAGARTVGLSLARGCHVAFVDSDDWITRGALEAATDRLRHSGDQVLFLGHTRVGEGSHVASGCAATLRRLDRAGSFTLRDRPEALRLFHVAWNKVYDRRFLLDSGLQFANGW
jgi:CDP-glycerol glycerophosphotransferase